MREQVLSGSIPCTMSMSISLGRSVRGLSDVKKTRSAQEAAASAMRGRLPLSLSPPQPATTTSLPDVRFLRFCSTFARASGVWA